MRQNLGHIWFISAYNVMGCLFVRSLDLCSIISNILKLYTQVSDSSWKLITCTIMEVPVIMSNSRVLQLYTILECSLQSRTTVFDKHCTLDNPPPTTYTLKPTTHSPTDCDVCTWVGFPGVTCSLLFVWTTDGLSTNDKSASVLGLYVLLRLSAAKWWFGTYLCRIRSTGAWRGPSWYHPGIP